MNPLSKEELIAEAKRYRDELKDFLPESMRISDEQIEKNVSKKYSLYEYAFEFTTGKYEKLNEFNKFVEANGQKNYCSFRGGEAQGLTEEQFSDRLKEVNTKEKAEHFQRKSLEGIVKADYTELIEVINDPKKWVKYSKEHGDFIYQGFTAGGLTKCTKLSNSNNSLINDNVKIFESLPAAMLNKMMQSANPISMLYEGLDHNLSQDEALTIMGGAGLKKICPMNIQSIEDRMLNETFGALSTSITEDYVSDLYDYLKENKIKDLSTLKPEKEGQTLYNAIKNGDKIVKKSAEEIKEMDADFNKYEQEALQQRMDDKVNSKALTKDEYKKFLNNINISFTDDKINENYADYLNDVRKVNSEQYKLDQEREKINQSYIDRSINAEKEYKKINGFTKFLSYLVPNTWTKAGRLRNEMQEVKEWIEGHDLEERLADARKEARSKELLDKDDAPDMRFDSPKKEPEKKQLDLSEKLNEGPNSSRESFEKENSLQAQKTNEKESSFDDFEIVDESQCK